MGCSQGRNKGKIIALTSRVKKQRDLERLELEKEIKRLEFEHITFGNKESLDLLKQNRQKLDDLLTYKVEGALRYTSRKYYEFGNRASRLLAFQLRKTQANRAVPKIRHPYTGIITSQPEEIVVAFKDYYKELYEREEQPDKLEKIKTFLDSVKLNRLTDEESKEMISPITEEEIKRSIDKLKITSRQDWMAFLENFIRVS